MTQTSDSSTKETTVDGVIVGFLIFLAIFTGVVLYKYNKTAVDTKVKRMVNRNAHVVILSTYGPSVQGSPFYETYVDKAVKYIIDPAKKVNELIIVGGYTVDPNISQSQAVLNYIKEKYPEFNPSNIPVTLDECGITTWQNIKNAKKLMDKEGIVAKKITIFAEESREKKVYFFANSTFSEFNGNDKDTIMKEIEGSIADSREIQLKSFHALDSMVTGEYVNKSNLVTVITEPAGLPQSNMDDEYVKLFQEVKEYLVPSYGKEKIKERLDSWSNTAGFNTIENLVQKGCVEYEEL